jgi:hypothetical protein
MGDGAVVVGGKNSDLYFTSLALSGSAQVKDTYKNRQRDAGETRSHGFFYKNRVRRRADPRTAGSPFRKAFHHLIGESAEVRFLNVSSSQSFSDIGALPRSRQKEPTTLQFSCVTGRGNSRPIFLRTAF